jgi:tRNA A37 threonylcarbamoyladenosine biosynthesis protein TsaE
MNDLDSNKILYTDSGKKIPELNINPKAYIDKTIVIYGPSKTGKTIITKNIMKTVNTYIDQILVISPSEPSNRSYEGYVDTPFIHYRLYLPDNSSTNTSKKDDSKERGLAFLESIWKRQEMMAAIYTRTNKIEVLESLFKYVVLHIREEASVVVKNIKHKCKKALADIEEQYKDNTGIKHAKIKDISSKFEDMLIQVYKKYIHIDYENIWRAKLTEDERYSLQYLCFNPRLLLIFDDCAAQLKPYFSKEIFRKLFYQNRHSFITVIVCCQDDTDLPANLRKNAFISFYTEPIVCLSNFERSSNKYSKQSRAYVAEIIPHVFKGFRKLAYIREDDDGNFFYHVTFDFPNMFKFGSEALHELCNAIQSEKTTMDTSNQYYEYFKI